MNKRKLLAIILIPIMIFTSIILTFNKNRFKNKYTVQFLSTAIRVLSDSQFKDFDLANRIYIHAFTNSAKILETFGENADNAITLLKSGSLSDNYIKAIADGLYGGSEIDSIDGVKGKPVKKIKFKQLFVGDILVYSFGGESKLLIKDKQNFVNLSNPTQNVDTKSVLEDVKNCEAFVVLRPMNIMENYDFSKNSSKQKLNDYQQAIISTAESYLLRGDKLQYADTRLGPGFSSEFRWKAGFNTPEDITTDEWGYTNCAAFCYDVYYHGLGYNLEHNGYKLYTTSNFATYSADKGIEVYKHICQTANTYSEEEKNEIIKEIKSNLEPADILVVRRSNGNGHAMLYTGDGNIIHSGGSVYNLNQSSEVYEASVRRMRFDDYFFVEGKAGYIFGSDTGAQVTSFYIIRPLKIWDKEIPEQTINRVENLSGIIAQKTASHNSAHTVNIGEEIVYNFEVYNTNDKKMKLEIRDELPTNTEYVSGGQYVSGKRIAWDAEIPANTREKFSYKVRVSSNAKKGDLIQNGESTVGGVKVVTKDFVVNSTLLNEQKDKLINEMNAYNTTSKKGFEVINDIYKNALGFTAFDDVQFDSVLDGVFSTNGAGYSLNYGTKYSDMLIPSLYGGRGFVSGNWTSRTRLPRESNLVVGDVLVRKTLSENQIYFYAGFGVFYNLTNGFEKDSMSAMDRLESCISTGNVYAILRPSFVR